MLSTDPTPVSSETSSTSSTSSSAALSSTPRKRRLQEILADSHEKGDGSAATKKAASTSRDSPKLSVVRSRLDLNESLREIYFHDPRVKGHVQATEKNRDEIAAQIKDSYPKDLIGEDTMIDLAIIVRSIVGGNLQLRYLWNMVSNPCTWQPPNDPQNDSLSNNIKTTPGLFSLRHLLMTRYKTIYDPWLDPKYYEQQAQPTLKSWSQMYYDGVMKSHSKRPENSAAGIVQLRKKNHRSFDFCKYEFNPNTIWNLSVFSKLDCLVAMFLYNSWIFFRESAIDPDVLFKAGDLAMFYYPDAVIFMTPSASREEIPVEQCDACYVQQTYYLFSLLEVDPVADKDIVSQKPKQVASSIKNLIKGVRCPNHSLFGNSFPYPLD